MRVTEGVALAGKVIYQIKVQLCLQSAFYRCLDGYFELSLLINDLT